MRYETSSAVLLIPHVIGNHIIQFRPHEVAYHWSVAFAVDDYDNASIVLEEVRTDDSAILKIHTKQSVFGTHFVLVYLVWIGNVSNPIILFINICIGLKMDFVAKDYFFTDVMRGKFLERNTDFANKIHLLAHVVQHYKPSMVICHILPNNSK